MPRLFLRLFLSYWAGLVATILVVFLIFPRPDNQSIAWALGSRIAAAIAVSGVACVLVARYITRPIAALSIAARALASGDLGARAIHAGSAGNAGKNEIEVLVEDFNQMAERLERIVESQRRLVRDVSHELRSPLARLNVALDLLDSAKGDVCEERERMRRDIDRLNSLIERLLALSRLDAANDLAAPEWFDLSDLITEVGTDAMREAVARGCEVECKIAQEFPMLGDYELLRSAIDNVVRNAVRHASTGSAVEVELSRDTNGSARICIRDTGPGIPESELENIFRPFYRVDRARTPGDGGFGLGLAIAQRAVRLHRGSIAATNRSPHGLTVEIHLPASDGSE
ncbi:MAG: HAMP domain-containing protein [Silvibacterium sp.]|nr:HAMP domain-containing protein [Silvibacterium sp.]